MTQNKHILIKNIYYMLSYAFKALSQPNFEDVATEEFENIHNLFAAILSLGIGQQLKQGLYREYLNQTDDIEVLRGKLDMPGSIRLKLARKQLFSCEYDELSENNLHNQIIKTTAIVLLRCDYVDAKYKDALKKEMLYFSGVDEILQPTSIPWFRVRFDRNNQTYQMLISVCRLIFEGMLLTTELGEHRLAAFLDEQRTSRLYEKFVLEYYRRHHDYLTDISAAQVEWHLEGEHEKSMLTFLPDMQTDITLRLGEKTLIIDTKYYGHTLQEQYDKYSLHNANLYQIYTYVKNMDKGNTGNVAGVILYAKTDEDVVPDCTFNMGGNLISAKTLDLNQEFSVIAGQLNGIVQEFFGIYKEEQENAK